MDTNDLATIIGRPVQAINEIMKGNKQIIPETALALADAFGTTTNFGLISKRITGLTCTTGSKAIRSRQDEPAILPTPDRGNPSTGWIAETESLDELEQAVCRFLGITSLDDTPALAASFRQATERSPELNAQIAWLARVRQLAQVQVVAPFDREKLRKTIPTIIELIERIEDTSRLSTFLASLGIHFVIVRHLPKTYIDGATFMLDDHPVVALSLRYDRIDNFWFTVFHELAHIVKGHRGLRVDNLEKTDEVDAEEQVANKLAGDSLIPQEQLNDFVRRTAPLFDYAAIASFAESIERHPGIVCGRLQKDKLIGYDRRKFLEKVSLYLKDFIEPIPERRVG